jgi:hypothetical protein
MLVVLRYEMPESVENRAMKLVATHYNNMEWHVTNVAREGGDSAGVDLIVTKDEKNLRLEVKGSSKPYHGIPDLYETEVDEQKRLKADFLCVAYFPPDGPERLAIIPGNFFHPDCLKKKVSYRISSEYKNEEAVKRFLVE